jgi:hypothetical protein
MRTDRARNGLRERRAGCDRREEELGPPHGWKERRRRTERRIPCIVEHDISADEWEHYFGGPKRPEHDAEGSG